MQDTGIFVKPLQNHGVCVLWHATLALSTITDYCNRQKKEAVVNEMLQLTAPLNDMPQGFLKDPVVAEFLQLPSNASFTETELEKAIIRHLKEFPIDSAAAVESQNNFSALRSGSYFRFPTARYFYFFIYCFLKKCRSSIWILRNNHYLCGEVRTINRNLLFH